MNDIAQHVEDEIRAIFSRVADMVAAGDVGASLDMDDTAGIPFALADAER